MKNNVSILTALMLMSGCLMYQMYQNELLGTQNKASGIQQKKVNNKHFITAADSATNVALQDINNQRKIFAVSLNNALKNNVVNTPDENGMTPLMLAVQYGMRSIINDLLQAGANPSLKDKKGHDALWYAQKKCLRGTLVVQDILNKLANAKPVAPTLMEAQDILNKLANAKPVAPTLMEAIDSFYQVRWVKYKNNPLVIINDSYVQNEPANASLSQGGAKQK